MEKEIRVARHSPAFRTRFKDALSSSERPRAPEKQKLKPGRKEKRGAAEAGQRFQFPTRLSEKALEALWEAATLTLKQCPFFFFFYEFERKSVSEKFERKKEEREDRERESRSSVKPAESRGELLERLHNTFTVQIF